MKGHRYAPILSTRGVCDPFVIRPQPETSRGPIYIDAQTREIVQNVYIRRVERINGQLYNTELDLLKDVKDPAKTVK